MKDTLISVIVPVYNVEPYVEQCLNSIKKQTYSTIEIIVVDDGSTDDSGIICEEHAKTDKRIKVIHKENGGLSDARNVGVESSNGEFITFIDSDDYVDENYIMKLKEIIELNDADIAIANRYEVEEDKVIIPKYYKGIKRENNNSLKVMEDFYYDKIPHEAWGKLYKRNIFEKCLYKKGLKVYEDIEFISRLLINKKLKVNYDTNQYLYYYRKRNDSIMNEGFNKLWNDEIIFYIELCKEISNESIKKAIETFIQSKIVRNLNIIMDYKFIDIDFVKGEIKFLQKNLKEIKTSINSSHGKKNRIKLFVLKNFSYIYIYYKTMKNRKLKSFYKKFETYVKSQRIKNDKLYLIFNGPNTGNIGDHAILFGEEKFLNDMQKIPFCISADEMTYFFALESNNKVNEKDEIYITGGGNIGTLWRNEQQRINQVLDMFKENSITIFPQTIFYSNNDFGNICIKVDSKFYDNCKNLTIYCRDKHSLDFVENVLNKKAYLKKDMALCLDYRKVSRGKNRKGILLCMRNDKEKIMDDSKREELITEIKRKYPNQKIKCIDTVLKNNSHLTYKKGKKEFNKLIKKFGKSKLVVTDRLHGMILSVISDTPCVAYNNCSGKVKGVYETIRQEKNIKVEYREN